MKTLFLSLLLITPAHAWEHTGVSDVWLTDANFFRIDLVQLHYTYEGSLDDYETGEFNFTKWEIWNEGQRVWWLEPFSGTLELIVTGNRWESVINVMDMRGVERDIFLRLVSDSHGKTPHNHMKYISYPNTRFPSTLELIEDVAFIPSSPPGDYNLSQQIVKIPECTTLALVLIGILVGTIRNNYAYR